MKVKADQARANTKAELHPQVEILKVKQDAPQQQLAYLEVSVFENAMSKFQQIF